MSDALFLVFSNAAGGRDEEFNKWYDEVHLPDVRAVPGIAGAQRYDLVDFTPDGVADAADAPAPAHRYLAVYDLEGTPESVFAEFSARMADGRMNLSDTLDMATVNLAIWKPRGPRL